jgi:hypothetical protein
MPDFNHVWDRIQLSAGERFTTATGLPFTYRVPGEFVRVSRDGREINRSLSRTNFQRAMQSMPAASPGALRDRQGASYTWAILMDKRIRQSDW